MKYSIRVVMAAIFVCYLIFTVTVSGAGTGDLDVHYINVSHGNAVLIQYDHKNMLIDAGPKTSAAELVSYLNNQSIKAFDIVVCTNPQEGSTGGMVEVLENFPVRLYIDGGEEFIGAAYSEIRDLLADKKIPYEETYAGDYLDFDDDIYVKVLSPGYSDEGFKPEPVVVQLDFEHIKFLFMSNADADKESELIDNYYMGTDILMAGNQGAPATCSKEFLEEVKPEVAIISSGPAGKYKPPSGETLERLKAAGAEIYRTDLNGTIVVTTDGDDYVIKTTGPKLEKGGVVDTTQVKIDLPPLYPKPGSIQPVHN